MAKEKIRMGARVGDLKEFLVIAEADTSQRGIGVFIGRNDRRKEFVVATFNVGTDWWHSGTYIPFSDERAKERALGMFVSKIDHNLTVFAP